MKSEDLGVITAINASGTFYDIKSKKTFDWKIRIDIQ